MRLAHIVSQLMEKYSERPAIGERDYIYSYDPVKGETFVDLLPKYKTLTFKQLNDKIEAIAGEWHHHPTYPLKDGDKVAILAFTSSDYAAIDIACIRLGAASIHLQTSSAKQQLEMIINETEPTIIAASVEYIEVAAELAKSTSSVKRVVVFDYHEKINQHAWLVETLNAQLKKERAIFTIEPLNKIMSAASGLSSAPFPDDREDPLSMLIYTSGSTGSPKGAIYTEQLASGMWGGSWSKIFSDKIATTIHYMPMNHVAGHSSLKNTLARGGISCFTSKSNLTSFFDDIRLVKPTELSLVPRVCEMIYQRYNSELVKRKLSGDDSEQLEYALKEHMRTELFGGRIEWAGCASAPLSRELHEFIESVLKIELHTIYGSTEAGVIWVDNHLLIPPVSDYKIVDVPELGYFTSDLPHPRGELLLKTKSIIPGYYNRPDLNADIFTKDGYYITGDIVEEISKNELQFLDRRKNVIKLSQGEFVAISNLEVKFSSSALIRQIFLYGRSEWSSLLAVVVPTQQILDTYSSEDKELKRLITKSMRKIATDHSLRPYEIPRDFVIEPVPFSQENGLLSEHGKPVWPKLRTHYHSVLSQLYEKLSGSATDELYNIYKIKDRQSTLETVIQLAVSLVGEAGGMEIEPSASFRDIGGDSLSAVSFSLTLEEVFGVNMPIDKIVSPVYCLNDIAKYIESKKNHINNRPNFTSIHGIAPTEVYASQLKLHKFIDPEILTHAKNLNIRRNKTKKVLLTGASGYLGRFICLKLLEELNAVSGELICIVRGKDPVSARLRLYNAFGDPDSALGAYFRSLADECLIVISGDISESRLGVDEESWQYLSDEIDTIYHIGALVNHVLSYDNIFEANVLGTTELIKLALSNKIKKLNFMSSIAVAASTSLDEYSDIRITIPHQKITGEYAGGYAISKWAGEVLLKEAHEKYGLPITLFRSSMILAHSRYEGQLNLTDMFTRLLMSIINTGLAPESFYQPYQKVKPHYDGLPVDFTASAIVALANNNVDKHLTYNLVNPHNDGISLDTIVDWLISSGISIDRIEQYDEWLKQFETAMSKMPENFRSQSYLPLLYGIKQAQAVTPGSIIPSDHFSNALKLLSINIPPITLSLIEKYVSDLKLKKMIPG